MNFDDPLLIVLIVIGAALLIYAAAAIKIVSQFEKGLIERFGRFDRMVDPGLGERSAMALYFDGQYEAAIASVSSGPDARTLMRLPCSAASIITPMMLLPFTSRSSRLTNTSDWNRAAVFTNSAHARACSPC